MSFFKDPSQTLSFDRIGDFHLLKSSGEVYGTRGKIKLEKIFEKKKNDRHDSNFSQKSLKHDTIIVPNSNLKPMNTHSRNWHF